MSWSIDFEEDDGFLVVRVTGENSREAVMGYAQEMLRYCEEHGHRRVLVEERLEGPRLSMIELFGLLDEGSRRMIGRFKAIAFVDEKMSDTKEFAEDVAVNRGIPIAVFDDKSAAEAWLTGSDS